MFVSLSKSGKIFQAGSVGEVNTATCPGKQLCIIIAKPQ